MLTKLSSILVLLLVLVSFTSSFEIGLRILVLNSADGSSNNAIYEALESRGIPRDTLTLPYTGELPLTYNNGQPLYYAIVIADNAGQSGLTAAQQAQVSYFTFYWNFSHCGLILWSFLV